MSKSSGLSPQEARYVDALADGNSVSDAYLLAGYDGAEKHAVAYNRKARKNPAIALALYSAIAARLNSAAPAALQTALDIMNDVEAPPKVRSDIALKLLQMAGHVAPRAAVIEQNAERSLSELPRDALIARCEAIEAELARRATPVSAELAPLGAQVLDVPALSAPAQGAEDD